MKMKKKTIATVAAVLLVLCCTVGGTLAWLSAKTQTVQNTFTVGDINITLAETTGSTYKMVPGNTIAKDPKVTVKAGSEDCWLFVQMQPSANFDRFMTTAIADGWTALPDETGVYYRTVAAGVADQSFAVLKNDCVTVRDTVTKEQLTAESFTNPTLSFTAYAVQQDNMTTAAAAWANRNG